MKKKFVAILVLMLSLAISVMTLSACDKDKVCTHEYGDWKVVTEPTCTVDGLKERTCKLCGEKESQAIKADHIWSSEWTVDIAPTYQSDGEKSHHCTKCDERKDITKIPNLTETCTHEYGDWKIVTEPTCTVDGLEERSCSLCGKKETQVVEAKHTWSDEWTIDIEASIGKEGEKSRHCTKCDERTDITKIPAKTASDLTYHEVTGGYMVTGIAKESENDKIIIVPETYMGKPVISIAPQAFFGQLQVTELYLADSITTIGDNAFEDMQNLEKIKLPSNLESIGDKAFEDTYKLTKIDLPDSVTQLGRDLFDSSAITSLHIPKNVNSIGDTITSRTKSLMSITVDENNADYYAEGNCLITKKDNTLIAGCTGSVIPNSVEIIAEYAFSGIGITKVIIPSSVQTIENFAFSGCESLVEVELNGLPDTNMITSSKNGFRKGVFSRCINLKKVTINEGVGKIGEEGFVNTAIEELILPDSLVRIETDAFKGSQLKRITFGKNLNPGRIPGLNSSGLLESIDLGTNTNKLFVLQDDCLFAGNYVRAFLNKEEITLPTSYTNNDGKLIKINSMSGNEIDDMHQVKRLIVPDGYQIGLLSGMTSLEEITFEGDITDPYEPNVLDANLFSAPPKNLTKINLSKQLTLGINSYFGSVLFSARSYDKVNPNLVITTPNTKEEWETKIQGAIMPTCTVVCSGGEEIKYKYNGEFEDM